VLPVLLVAVLLVLVDPVVAVLVGEPAVLADPVVPVLVADAVAPPVPVVLGVPAPPAPDAAET
jgi:hypothetical protein